MRTNAYRWLRLRPLGLAGAQDLAVGDESRKWNNSIISTLCAALYSGFANFVRIITLASSLVRKGACFPSISKRATRWLIVCCAIGVICRNPLHPARSSAPKHRTLHLPWFERWYLNICWKLHVEMAMTCHPPRKHRPLSFVWPLHHQCSPSFQQIWVQVSSRMLISSERIIGWRVQLIRAITHTEVLSYASCSDHQQFLSAWMPRSRFCYGRIRRLLPPPPSIIRTLDIVLLEVDKVLRPYSEFPIDVAIVGSRRVLRSSGLRFE